MCEFCNSECKSLDWQIVNVESSDGGMKLKTHLNMDSFDNGKTYRITAFATYADVLLGKYAVARINYCPMCGRKLGE